jgi:hypothetical protein
VTEPELPAEAYGRAAALHPGLLAPRELSRRLRKEWDFATAYARGAGPEQLRELAAVLDVLDAGEAYQVLDAIDRHLPEHARTELARTIIGRLEPHQRLEPIRRYAPRGAERDPAWNTLSIDALVDHTLRVRNRDGALWGPGAILLTRSSDARVRAWDDLRASLRGGMFETHVQAALHAVEVLPSERERDAAFELIVDAGATQLLAHRDAWLAAMRELEAAGPDAPGDFAVRLARAALRPGDPDRRLIALRTVHWVAKALDRRDLGRGEVGEPPFSRLHERLHAIDVEVVDEAARAASRGPGQKWLKDTVKALRRRLA